MTEKPSARAWRIESREKEFRKIAGDPETALRDFNVRYVALTMGGQLPPAIASEIADEP